MKNRRFPYGYEMRDGEIVICQTEAEIVRTIFRDYVDGKGLKDIAEKLTALKVEYLPGESNWNKSRIKRMIEDKRRQHLSSNTAGEHLEGSKYN